MKKILNPESILFSAVIAVFSVVFLWGFFESGISALGLNTSILGLLLFGLFLYKIPNLGDFIKKNYFWMIPFVWIILSFSLYENPFLKGINILLLPFLMVFFFSYAKSSIEGDSNWNLGVIARIVSRDISPDQSQKAILQTLNYGDESKALIKKVVIGVAILAGINVFIIGLLTSADSGFSEVISGAGGVLSLESVLRVVTAIVLFVLIIAMKISWDGKYLIKNEAKKSSIDSVIAGIVIGGTLLTYLVFISVQIDTIMTGVLPGNTDDVATLVKNGFWQLFFVSIINIFFFFVYFKKTNELVQNLLGAFVVASIIILFSAGHKMFLYVYSYGLSYEKFFAFYTVFYFGILFLTMLGVLFSKKLFDILKVSLILALWMYSFLNVFPTEKFIFETNTATSLREDAKILRYQSHMLSVDILNSVKKLKGSDIYEYQNWDEWIENRAEETSNKKWFEKNIRDF